MPRVGVDLALVRYWTMCGWRIEERLHFMMPKLHTWSAPRSEVEPQSGRLVLVGALMRLQHVRKLPCLGRSRPHRVRMSSIERARLDLPTPASCRMRERRFGRASWSILARAALLAVDDLVAAAASVVESWPRSCSSPRVALACRRVANGRRMLDSTTVHSSGPWVVRQRLGVHLHVHHRAADSATRCWRTPFGRVSRRTNAA